MKEINGIPVFKATLKNKEDKMLVVSLVDEPAIERNFLAFGKEKVPMAFSVESEEERMILGPIMIPGLPIIRLSEDGAPYYIVYEAETIHEMAELYFKENRINNVDTQHNFQLVDGVTLVQAFFKNTEKGINPAGFEDLPDDTLFFQYHVENDEVWDEVKKGTFQGFSLAGIFNVEQFKKQNILSDIEELLMEINNKIKNN